jgi:hypothetical protein
MDRANHYEAAFEAYLQWHRHCYVAVDETHRSLFGDERVKSLDFIVHGDGPTRLLIDVKGRRFPGGTADRPRHVWECWSTRADVDGLERWAGRFGLGYMGVLVFAYHVLPTVDLPAGTDDFWTWRGRRYLFRAVAADDYREHMRVRSPRWETVSLPQAVFRRLVRPVHHFTREPAEVPDECPF